MGISDNPIWQAWQAHPGHRDEFINELVRRFAGLMCRLIRIMGKGTCK